MIVSIAGASYRLVVMRGELRFQGERYPVICDHEKRQIQVSDELNPNQRMAAVANAVSDCWKQVAVDPLVLLRNVGDVD